MGHPNCRERLAQGANLIHLDQNRVGNTPGDAVGKTGDVGYEQIVAHKLTALADQIGQQLPAVPIILRHAVLDRDDRKATDQIRQVLCLRLGAANLSLPIVVVTAFPEKLSRRTVECEHNVFARPISGGFDRADDEAEGVFRRGEVGGKAAFVTDVRVMPRLTYTKAPCG